MLFGDSGWKLNEQRQRGRKKSRHVQVKKNNQVHRME